MKVLCVCLGNICRSPLAEGILRARAAEMNISIEVDSCGTANYHVGDAPDIRSINKARSYGIDISQLKGRQFQLSDFESFDVIFVMDKSNLINIKKLDTKGLYDSKIKLILNEITPFQNLEVPDPYYGSEQDFEDVYQMLNKATISFLKSKQ